MPINPITNASITAHTLTPFTVASASLTIPNDLVNHVNEVTNAIQRLRQERTDTWIIDNTSAATTWPTAASSCASWSNVSWADATNTIVVPISAATTTATNADFLVTFTTDTASNLYWPVTRTLTPEQIEAERVRVGLERESRETARNRAEALLNRHLNESQRKTLSEHGWVMVTARGTGNRYRVYRGRSHNVKKLDARDREVQSLCAHPVMLVPEADCMLSQILMLEMMEDRFLQLANKRDIARPVAPTFREVFAA